MRESRGGERGDFVGMQTVQSHHRGLFEDARQRVAGDRRSGEDEAARARNAEAAEGLGIVKLGPGRLARLEWVG